jgi:hypothetical protein
MTEHVHTAIVAGDVDYASAKAGYVSGQVIYVARGSVD